MEDILQHSDDARLPDDSLAGAIERSINQEESVEFYKEELQQEITMWEGALNALPAIDVRRITRDVESLNMENLMPNEGLIDSALIAAKFYDVNTLREKLSRVFSILVAHESLLKDCHDSMKETARLTVVTGTDKTKEAKARAIIKHISARLGTTRALLRMVKEKIEYMEFARESLSAIAYDRRNEARINPQLMSEGANLNNKSRMQTWHNRGL